MLLNPIRHDLWTVGGASSAATEWLEDGLLYPIIDTYIITFISFSLSLDPPSHSQLYLCGQSYSVNVSERSSVGFEYFPRLFLWNVHDATRGPQCNLWTVKNTSTTTLSNGGDQTITNTLFALLVCFPQLTDLLWVTYGRLIKVTTYERQQRS